jgi:hypothetical protein
MIGEQAQQWRRRGGRYRPKDQYEPSPVLQSLGAVAADSTHQFKASHCSILYRGARR